MRKENPVNEQLKLKVDTIFIKHYEELLAFSRKVLHTNYGKVEENYPYLILNKFYYNIIRSKTLNPNTLTLFLLFNHLKLNCQGELTERLTKAPVRDKKWNKLKSKKDVFLLESDSNHANKFIDEAQTGKEVNFSMEDFLTKYFSRYQNPDSIRMKTGTAFIKEQILKKNTLNPKKIRHNGLLTDSQTKNILKNVKKAIRQEVEELRRKEFA